MKQNNATVTKLNNSLIISTDEKDWRKSRTYISQQQYGNIMTKIKKKDKS